MKSWSDIARRQCELPEGYTVENNLLEGLEIKLIGHFGNVTTLAMWFTNCCLFDGYNLGGMISEVIKVIVECLELTEEDGLLVKDIQSVPVRIVVNGSRVVGFGHFMKDRFLLAEDVLGLAKDNLIEQVTKIVQ